VRLTPLQGNNREFLQNPSASAKNRPENIYEFSCLRRPRSKFPARRNRESIRPEQRFNSRQQGINSPQQGINAALGRNGKMAKIDPLAPGNYSGDAQWIPGRRRGVTVTVHSIRLDCTVTATVTP